MRKNKPRLIALGIFVTIFFLLFFGVRPALHKKEAVETVETILKNWKHNDFTYNHVYWLDLENVPPLYHLTDFTLVEKKFTDQHGEKKAFITTILEFEIDDIYPTGEKWEFELIDTSEGWKVNRFELLR